MKRNAKVVFGGSTNPSCFASVSWPMTYQQDNSNLNVIKIETESSAIHYLSVIGGGGGAHLSKLSSDQLRIHSKLGATLVLQEGEIVSVSPYSGPITEIRRANVVCVSRDDWEILESNTDAVVNGLLNQLRVIYLGQKFPFWITKSLQINLTIESLEPEVSHFGILTANSEIIVPSISSVIPTTHPLALNTKLLRLRIHPIVIPDSVLCTFPTSSLLLKNTRHAFILRESLRNLANNSDSADMEEELSSNYDPYFLAQVLLPNNVALRVQVFLLELSGVNEELLKYFCVTNPPCIYLHPELISQFNMDVKSYIWVKNVMGDDNKSEDVENMGKLCLLGNAWADNFLQKEELCKNVFSTVLDECQRFVQESLALGSESQPFTGPNNGCLLIEGKTGSGKTWMSTTLSKRLEEPPYHVHCEILTCSKWRGKKPETIEKELKIILEKAQSMQPSLLILDDLDIITPLGMSQQENLQEQFLHFKICETIRESLLTYSDQQLSVIATAKSGENLNPYWKSRQGFHFFHKTVFIPPPTSEERLQIFENCLTRYNLSTDKISSLLNDIRVVNLLKNMHDQYATPRLISTVSKKLAASFLTQSDQQCEDFITLDNFIVDEIKFYDMEGKVAKKSDVANIKWENVGGLHQIKEDLVKILQWPIKYKKLFENAPIKLPCGILLFGYPGTGKTLLGLAIPSLVNTKFIHIKGPELLSKYIGASEQAVQDVFKRARNSSPCVLFFDEFDSLVPRRGHDSTGVTDRVVNQFLAEMDGIEGGLGQGVYLVGATSRPDLIDPAVLRPGRLDKHLFFNLPTKDERKEILSHLGAQVNLELSPDESLDLLTERMKGLTGADIHSLVCSAQLSAVQKYLAKLGEGWNNEPTSDEEQYPSIQQQKKDPGNKDLTPLDIPVKLGDLEEALSTFRPSLHGEELARFRNIYERFSMGGGGGSGDTRQIPLTGKRATLA